MNFFASKILCELQWLKLFDSPTTLCTIRKKTEYSNLHHIDKIKLSLQKATNHSVDTL